MRKTFLTTLSLAVGLTVAYAQNIPVFYNQDLPIPIEGQDTSFSVGIIGTVAVPTEGANQVWDYSNVTSGGTGSFLYLPADTNLRFPQATSMNLYNTGLGFLTLQGSKSYRQQNSTGRYNLGFETQGVKYPIGAVSGNAGDTLEAYAADSNFNYLGLTVPEYVFPLTYQSTWNSDYVALTNFKLTVAAFGLNKAPVVVKQYAAASDSVAGWGKVKIPNSTLEYPALLIKHTVIGIDSFFVGGQPAPAALLNAFGLTQGSSFANYEYEIRIAGIARSAVFFVMDSAFASVTSASYSGKLPSTNTTNYTGPVFYNEDLPMPIGSDSSRSYSASTAMVMLPTEGANQVWDYSLLQQQIAFGFSYQVPDSNAVFPTATALNIYNPALGFLSLQGSKAYFEQNNKGRYELGLQAQGFKYPIGAASGNPADTLTALPVAQNTNEYGKDVKDITFPLTHQTTWGKESIIGNTNFTISVAAFGLNNAPITVRQYRTSKDTIVGWGVVKLPNNSNDLPALLNKYTSTRVDSFLLGGQPAPAALLGAFGLTQGTISKSYTYEILVAGTTRSAVYFETSAAFDSITFISYNRALSNPTSLATKIDNSAVSVFPNPTKEGWVMLQANKETNGTWSFELFDLQGKRVNVTSIAETGITQKRISTEGLANGMYIYRITDNGNNSLVKSGKIIVNQ